jgi:hypothetical protein
MSCFSFYLLSFSFYKIKEQEGRTGPAEVRWLGTNWKEKVVRKGGSRVTIVQKMCTHVCKCKNESC